MNALRLLLVTGALATFALPGLAQILITRTFTPNLPIPDHGEAADARVLDLGGGTIQNVQVDLTLLGSGGPAFNGDYYATLGHGSGFAVLLNRPGRTASSSAGYSDNGFNVTFSDAASDDIHGYRAALGGPPAGPLIGVWAPDGRTIDPAVVVATDPRTAMLSSFNGLSPDGEWRLFIADEASGGGANLGSWTLRMVVLPDGATAMRFDNFELKPSGGPQTLANPFEFTGASKISGTDNITFQGALSGSGTLTKEGTGTLIIAQPNLFAGALAITGGVVQLPAGLGGAGGAVSLDSGARLNALGSVTRDLVNQGVVQGPDVGSGQFLTLSGAVTGAGTFEGRIAIDGAFSPGNSPAIVTTNGDLSLGAGNLLTMEIGGLTRGTQYDGLDVTGTLTLDGTLRVSLINSFSPITGETFLLFDAGTLAGGFSSFQLPSLGGGLAWDTSQLGSLGSLSVTAIPEPAAFAFVVGVGALVACWRRRRATPRKEILS